MWKHNCSTWLRFDDWILMTTWIVLWLIWVRILFADLSCGDLDTSVTFYAVFAKPECLQCGRYFIPVDILVRYDLDLCICCVRFMRFNVTVRYINELRIFVSVFLSYTFGVLCEVFCVLYASSICWVSVCFYTNISMFGGYYYIYLMLWVHSFAYFLYDYNLRLKFYMVLWVHK